MLSSGAVLLDGRPVQFEELEQTLENARRNDDVVWYYREDAAQTPPQRALEVLNLVVQNELRVSLSSKADFSDYVDAKGASHPRPFSESSAMPAFPASAAESVRMPEVSSDGDIEEIFAMVRRMAAGEKRKSALIVLRPDRRYLVLPAMAETPALKYAALSLERLVPSKVQRNIAVIAYTVFSARGEPSIPDVGRSIPFLGMLMGLTYIGHPVWVFEGHPSALDAGCRGADVLIVDGAMVNLLDGHWQDIASAVMRNSNILVHDRETFQLRILRKVGEQMGALGFADQRTIDVAGPRLVK